MKHTSDKQIRKIVIGIPTLNEADSIQNTLLQIDKGASLYLKGFAVTIINIDGNSTDATRKLFLNTRTKSQKLSTLDKGNWGKGGSILRLIEFCERDDVDAFCMFDADTKTISPTWIRSILTPILDDCADLVTPLYTRNRYEANTTNHFCYPIMRTVSDQFIAQPIGGDFAISKRLIKRIAVRKPPISAYGYGIDIYITMSAAFGGFRIASANLGRKIHKPSFNKIEKMFVQVASTSLYMLSNYSKQQASSRNAHGSTRRTDFLSIKPKSSAIKELKAAALGRIRESESSDDLFISTESKKFSEKGGMTGEEWNGILSRFLSFVFSHRLTQESANELACTLTPFFLLRVVTYFDEIQRVKRPSQIDDIIEKQAESLRNSLTKSVRFLDQSNQDNPYIPR